jgi:hypothetical protein
MNPTGLLLAALLSNGGGREARGLIRGLEELIAAAISGGSTTVLVTDLQNLLVREMFVDREGSGDMVGLLLLLASQAAGQQGATAAPSTTPATTTTTGIDPTVLIALVLLLQQRNRGW